MFRRPVAIVALGGVAVWGTIWALLGNTLYGGMVVFGAVTLAAVSVLEKS